MKTVIELPVRDLADICRRYDVTELAVFGSVLRDDFGDDSDIDFLAVFGDRTPVPWAVRLYEMERALSDLLGRHAEVADREAVEESDNYLRKAHILGTAETVYAEG
jgi:predicted nucleotidyltransferase